MEGKFIVDAHLESNELVLSTRATTVGKGPTLASGKSEGILLGMRELKISDYVELKGKQPDFIPLHLPSYCNARVAQINLVVPFR